MLPRRPAAPLAACGLVLCGLAIVGLARWPEPPEPAREPREEVLAPTEASDPLARGEPIDLNRASAADLELLPRIGPTLAARVVADRSAHGRYETVDALRRVRGIGPRTLERLRPHVTVGSTGPDAGASP